MLDFLKNRMDMKPEFFEVLHTFFIGNTQKFVSTALKYVRRGKALEAAKDPARANIPIQSLVTLPSLTAENVINMV